MHMMGYIGKMLFCVIHFSLKNIMCELCSHMVVTNVSKCPLSLVSWTYFCILEHSHFEDIKGTVHVSGRT